MTAVLLALETLLAPLAALGVVLAFLVSRRRGVLAGLSSELPERLGGLAPEGRALLAGREVWWLHAASAGEVGGLSPLIARLSARPGAAVLVTTMTVAGREAARRDPSVSWAQLAPLDAWPCVARFLSAARPARLVLSETELWPTLIVLAARAGLRPVLVNGRVSGRSFPRYRLAAPLLGPVLGALEGILAQGEPDAERFRALGAPRVDVAGNTKYDRAAAPPDGSAADAAIERLAWGPSPLFVAGSTHPVEEDAVVRAFLRAAERVPALRLVLAPRHVERAAEAAATLRAAGLEPALWSRRDAPPPGARVLLLDAMGVLGAFWPRAAVAYVGGTLVPVGGHNLLEPAAAGVPVLFGPWTAHVEHPALLLEKQGGGLRVAGPEGLAEALSAWAADPRGSRAAGGKAREMALRLSGATERVYAVLTSTSAAVSA